MNKNFLLPTSVILVLTGALMKIFHVLDSWNNLIFYAGFAIAALYSILYVSRKQTKN